MKIVNKLLNNVFVKCHLDLLPFCGRRPNLMLLLSSHAGTHFTAPFFSLSRKGSLLFTALSRANSHLTNMTFCNLSEQVLLFNLMFEISLNLQ